MLEYDVKRSILVPSKKNQKQIVTNPKNGKMYIIGSAQYLKWQKEHDDIFNDFHKRLALDGISLPIARCKVKALFYFPDSKDRDLTNKFDTIADELRSHGIIWDDKFKVLKPVNLDGWVCRNRPRTEVYITIISPDSPEYTWDITSEQHEVNQLARRALQTKMRRAKKASIQE